MKTGEELTIQHLIQQRGKIVREMAKRCAMELDRKLWESIIGSKIVAFDMEPIKGRKTMYKMTILTDGKPVVEDLPSGTKVKYLTNEIVVRVKLRR